MENINYADREKYKFLLFISGMSPKSARAIENIRIICDKYLAGNFELNILDVNREQQLASEYQIIAIPTLIKTQPFQRRIILGDLSETEKVLRILEIDVASGK